MIADGFVNVDGSNRAWLASTLPWLDAAFVKLGLFSPTEFSSKVSYMNLLKGIRFPDASVSCIYSGELWEHFEYDDAVRVTKECFRVLKPNGVLRLCVPDGPTFWREYLALYDRERVRPLADRDEAALRERIELYFREICTRRPGLRSMGHTHKWQFDDIQLEHMLRSCGFGKVERMKFHDSRISGVELVERSNFLIVEGVKPSG